MQQMDKTWHSHYQGGFYCNTEEYKLKAFPDPYKTLKTDDIVGYVYVCVCVYIAINAFK